MDISDYREMIDRIDDELLRLFKERMNVSRQIALYKTEHGLSVKDAAREKEKLAAVAEKSGEELSPYAQRLYSVLFEISRSYQENI